MGFEGSGPHTKTVAQSLLQFFNDPDHWQASLPCDFAAASGSLAENAALAGVFLITGSLILAIRNISVQIVHARTQVEARAWSPPRRGLEVFFMPGRVRKAGLVCGLGSRRLKETWKPGNRVAPDFIVVMRVSSMRLRVRMARQKLAHICGDVLIGKLADKTMPKAVEAFVASGAPLPATPWGNALRNPSRLHKRTELSGEPPASARDARERSKNISLADSTLADQQATAEIIVERQGNGSIGLLVITRSKPAKIDIPPGQPCRIREP